MAGLTGWHALILLVIIVLIFGAAKLPALAKSVGQSMKIFKNEIKPEDTVKLPADASRVDHMSADAQPLSDTAGNKLHQ